MVRIRDGEIVSDEDDRKRPQAASSSSSAASGDRSQPRQNTFGASPSIFANTDNAARPGPGAQNAQSVSLFDAANNWLLNAGVPRIPLHAELVIEPVAAVGVMLALVIFGLPGLAVVALMFLIRQLSRPDSRWGARLGNFIGLDTATPPAAQRGTGAARPPAAGTSGTGTAQGARAAKSKSKFQGNGYKLGSD